MLADKIRMLRLSQGLSQTDFAKRLYVTPGAVNQWERGKTSPDTGRLLAIAKEFSVPLDYFSDEEKDYSETELIKQHIMIELGADIPKTTEAKIISGVIDKMPPEKREQALNIMKAVFTQYADSFERKEDDK